MYKSPACAFNQQVGQAHTDNSIPNIDQFGAVEISGEEIMATGKGTSNLVTAKDFAEELYEVQSWYELGVFLGAPVIELNRIRNTNESVRTNLVELFELMNRQGILLTWDKIADALESLGNHQLASQIRQNHMTAVEWTNSDNTPIVEQCLPCSVYSSNLHHGHIAQSMTPTQPFPLNIPSSSSSQDPTDGESHEESENIPNPKYLYLDHEYVKKVQTAQFCLGALQSSIINGLKCKGIDVLTLEMTAMSYFKDFELSMETTTMLDAFEKARKGCSHEEYVQFLRNIIIANLDDNKSIKTKLLVYEQHCGSLVREKSLGDIVSKIPQHTGQRAVELKLPPPYQNVPVEKFDAFNKYIFKKTYPKLRNMRVTEGCICVSWIVTDIKEVIEDIHESWDQLDLAGVISVSVGEREIFKGSPDNNGGCCSEEMVVVDEGYYSVKEACDLELEEHQTNGWQ